MTVNSLGRFPKEQGVVLVISLIMLLAVTLIIVAASNVVQSNLKIVQNLESREKVRYAAIAAIEEALSSDRFASSPESIFSNNPCGNNRRCYDIDGNIGADIIVDLLRPSCISAVPIKNAELDVFNNPKEATCYVRNAVYSMCAGSLWEFEALATDTLTGAEVTVRQGVTILTTLNKIETACPS